MTYEEPEARLSNSQPANATSQVDSGGRAALGMPRPKPKRPPPSARCPNCGNSELSSLPTFSAGSGVAMRPFAEDILCHGCGFIGMPDLIVPNP